jgi:hypothetical protein
VIVSLLVDCLEDVLGSVCLGCNEAVSLSLVNLMQVQGFANRDSDADEVASMPLKQGCSLTDLTW